MYVQGGCIYIVYLYLYSSLYYYLLSISNLYLYLLAGGGKMYKDVHTNTCMYVLVC